MGGTPCGAEACRCPDSRPVRSSYSSCPRGIGGGFVALTAGVLGGEASTVGCVIGGSLADRVGSWRLFFGTGVAMAPAAILMALASRTPTSLAWYSLVQGTSYAAFSALLLHAIGCGAAAMKHPILSSLGNVPDVT